MEEESLHVKVPVWLKNRLNQRSKKLGMTLKEYTSTALLAFEAVQEAELMKQAQKRKDEDQ